MREMELLKVVGLKTYYDSSRGVIRAVDGVDVSVQKGDVVGVVGETGCGKSTLGRSILRLIDRPGKIVDGQILFRGKDLLQLREDEMRRIRGNHISMIFQDPMTFLNPLKKIKDQVGEVLSIHEGKSSEEAYPETIRVLEEVGLKDFAEHYPHQLSGGQRQRVLIAMAIVHRPALLIADEPTTALDVAVQAEILSLLKEMIRKHDLSAILITHNLAVVAELCNRVYVMYAGKVVEFSSTGDALLRPKHPYLQGLMNAARSIFENRETESITGEPPDLANPPSGCRFHPRCPYAMEICQEKEPPLVIVDESLCACWLYDTNAKEARGTFTFNG